MDSKVEHDAKGSDDEAIPTLNDSLAISSISEASGARTLRRNRRAARAAMELRKQGLRSTSRVHDRPTLDVDSIIGAMSTAMTTAMTTALSSILPDHQLGQVQDSVIQSLKGNLSKQASSRHQSYKFPRQMTTPYSNTRMASRAFRPTSSGAKSPVADS